MKTSEKYVEEEISDFDKQHDKYKSCHKTYMRIPAVRTGIKFRVNTIENTKNQL